MQNFSIREGRGYGIIVRSVAEFAAFIHPGPVYLLEYNLVLRLICLSLGTELKDLLPHIFPSPLLALEINYTNPCFDS